MIFALIALFWWSTIPGALHTTSVLWLLVFTYFFAMLFEGGWVTGQ